MHFASSGPHRAFMGVGLMVVIILAFGLVVGWKWYFDLVDQRQQIIRLSADAEARAAISGLDRAPRPIGESDPAGAVSTPGLPLTGIAPGSQAGRYSGVPVPEPPVIEELLLDAIESDVAAAEELLNRYWATSSWEQRLPMVRDPDRVKPLMQTYYEGQIGTDPLPGNKLGSARFRIDGLEVLHFSFESARPSGVLELAMVRDERGVFRLDWESWVGYCDKTFVQMRLQRPTEPLLVRAIAKFEDYYNFEFSDPSKFICMKLISPDGGYSLFGYAERGSEVGEWLERELAGQSAARGMTLMVAYPPNAQSDQCLEIKAVLADRWLLTR